MAYANGRLPDSILAPIAGGRLRKDAALRWGAVVDRFLAKCVEGPDGCLDWAGARINSGYGKFKMPDRIVSAHRAAYALFRGDIPDEMQVLHTCDRKLCVNPEHLFIGTQQDNVDDMRRKGREAWHGYWGGSRKCRQGCDCARHTRSGNRR